MNHLQVGPESGWLVQAGAATLLLLHIGGGAITSFALAVIGAMLLLGIYRLIRGTPARV